MKKIIYGLLVFASCQSESEKLLNKKQEAAKKDFSKGVGEGVAYNVFPVDSSALYTDRFVKIIMDSSDSYVERYAKAFRYLTNKRIIPTEKAIKEAVNNPFIYKMKD